MADSIDERDVLLADYPDVFGKCYAGVGDGWLKILREGAEELRPLIKKYQEDEDADFEFHTSTIKEKYGTLRWYTGSVTDEMFDVIQHAEEKSSEVCEVCGKDGRMVNSGGWMSVRCTDCCPDVEEKNDEI